MQLACGVRWRQIAQMREGAFELVTLRNGRRAVRHVGHGEIMHPTVGPWEEANHLYVAQAGLRERLVEPGPPLVLYDVGLGAATNAVAALTCARSLGAQQRRTLQLVSMECDLAPLRLALADAEGFPFLQPFAGALRQLMEGGRTAGAGFEWQLALGDMQAVMAGPLPAADVVFFDPFSPQVTPEVWSPPFLRALHGHATGAGRGCVLFTYSAATAVRTSLLVSGFFVGSGVSTGSRSETTAAATRLDLLGTPLGARWLARWERSSAKAPPGTVLDPQLTLAVRQHPQFFQPDAPG